MKRVSYTSKTLKLLEKQGYRTGIVERFIPMINIRKDLFGIIDIIAIAPKNIIGIQSTSWHQRKPHLDLIYVTRLEDTKAWLDSGAHLWLVTWKKILRKRGGTAFTYEPHVDIIDLEKGIEVV